ncbi:MAG: MAPEG family protein [Porticoccaceae bacterium]
MSLTVLPFFLGIFSFFYLFLALRIGYMRGSPVMKIFFKMEEAISEETLQRNVRAHGNFSEYVPIFSILLLALEIENSTALNYLITATVIFAYGRLAHGICFAFFKFNPFLRITGMLGTYVGLALLAYQAIAVAV